jgi:hypothetical protein
LRGAKYFNLIKYIKLLQTPERTRIFDTISVVKNKLLIFVKLALLAFFSLLWFILVQGEYEMITKPELQNEFPIIKGIYAVYFLGFILLIISVIIAHLSYSIIKSKNGYLVKSKRHEK